MCGQVRFDIPGPWLKPQVFLAMQFNRREVVGWEIFYVHRHMSRSDVSYLITRWQF